jgi:hypothetical protein
MFHTATPLKRTCERPPTVTVDSPLLSPKAAEETAVETRELAGTEIWTSPLRGAKTPSKA